MRLDRARELARRDRDGRGVEQLGRRHPRAARERRLLAGVGAQQGVHPRRGPHALDGRVERVPEDARGAAAEHGVRARDDRGAEGAGDGRRPLPPLRLPPPDGRADRVGRAPRRAGRVDRDSPGGGRRRRPLRDGLLPRRARHARAAAHLQRQRDRARRTCWRCSAWPMRACWKSSSTPSTRATRAGRCSRWSAAFRAVATRARSPRTSRCTRASCWWCRRWASCPPSSRSPRRPTRACAPRPSAWIARSSCACWSCSARRWRACARAPTRARGWSWPWSRRRAPRSTPPRRRCSPASSAWSASAGSPPSPWIGWWRCRQ